MDLLALARIVLLKKYEVMLDWGNHPKSTPEVGVLNIRLMGHRLPKDNWHEEVKYLEPSGNYLKTTSPAIYAKITADEN